MKIKYALVAATLWFATGALADDGASSQEFKEFKDAKDQQSYAIGAQTGRTLKKDNVDINVDLLMRGLKDGLDGGKLQMSENDMRAVMSRVQQDLHKNMVMNRRQAGQRNLEQGAAFLAENGRKPGVVTTKSGLEYTVIKTGTGSKPALQDTVKVTYRGTRLDGLEFDASEAGKPTHLVVAQAIPAWKEALPMMTAGSKWQLAVPATLAYGERGSGADVAPNQVLLFDVELNDVVRAK